MKKVGILGATGSIGRQALDIIRNNRNDYQVVLLSCGENTLLLDELKKEFNPKLAFAKNDTEMLSDSSTYSDCDIVINGIGGIYGLMPSVGVLKSKADLASANKESIVAAGRLLMDLASKNNKKIIPVDSEHSAVWQCLEEGNVSKIILTASGGPFVDKSKEELALVTATESLNHPTWKMGKKVTIDSATLMNKGMEVLEARWLFDTKAIEVVVHRQSLVHAIVEFFDGSYKMSVSNPDMRMPIQLALTYPKRKNCLSSLDFSKINSLKFEKPDLNRFECLKIAFDLLNEEHLGVVLQAADEIAAELFLNNKIGFMDIPKLINKALDRYNNVKALNFIDVLSIDKEVKEYTLKDIIKI